MFTKGMLFEKIMRDIVKTLKGLNSEVLVQRDNQYHMSFSLFDEGMCRVYIFVR